MSGITPLTRLVLTNDAGCSVTRAIDPSTLKTMAEQSPRDYVGSSMLLLAHAAGIIALVNPEMLGELAATGGAHAGNEEARAAIIDAARAAQAFLESAKRARACGVL